MNIEDKSMKELLELHNSIAAAPAGPKTFSTRAKLVTRIRSLAETQGINLDSFAASSAQEQSDSGEQPDSTAPGTEATSEPGEPKKRGLGIGELARMLLLDPTGYPHSLIAAMVNEQIPGATATDKSVRWYAAKMRKDGVEVPPRAKAFPSNMGEKQSSEWLKTIRVVG